MAKGITSVNTYLKTLTKSIPMPDNDLVPVPQLIAQLQGSYITGTPNSETPYSLAVYDWKRQEKVVKVFPLNQIPCAWQYDAEGKFFMFMEDQTTITLVKFDDEQMVIRFVMPVGYELQKSRMTEQNIDMLVSEISKNFDLQEDKDAMKELVNKESRSSLMQPCETSIANSNATHWYFITEQDVIIYFSTDDYKIIPYTS